MVWFLKIILSLDLSFTLWFTDIILLFICTWCVTNHVISESMVRSEGESSLMTRSYASEMWQKMNGKIGNTVALHWSMNGLFILILKENYILMINNFILMYRSNYLENTFVGFIQNMVVFIKKSNKSVFPHHAITVPNVLTG